MELRYRKLNRWAEFDYSQNGWYFVTICTGKRIKSLCHWNNGHILPNKYGEIVEKQWNWIGEHFDNVKIDDHVIMPNHVHGIVIINNVGTGRDLSLQKKQKPLSQIIGAFKTTSSKLIHQNGYTHFCWQRSFHDHIIRSEKELMTIQSYIKNNRENWENDRNNI